MRLGGKQLGPALANMGETMGGLTTQLEGRRKKQALQAFVEKLVNVIKDPAFNPTPQQIIEMAQQEGLATPKELQVCFELVNEFVKAGASYQEKQIAGQVVPGAKGSPTWREAGQFGKTFGPPAAARRYGFGEPKLTPGQKGRDELVERITAQGGQPVQSLGLPGAGLLSQRGPLRHVPGAGEGRPEETFAMPPAASGYKWVGTEQKKIKEAKSAKDPRGAFQKKIEYIAQATGKDEAEVIKTLRRDPTLTKRLELFLQDRERYPYDATPEQVAELDRQGHKKYKLEELFGEEKREYDVNSLAKEALANPEQYARVKNKLPPDIQKQIDELIRINTGTPGNIPVRRPMPTP